MSKHKTVTQAQEVSPETPIATAPAEQRQPGDDPAEQPKKFAPDPFGIASDKAAGVRLAESRRYRQSLLSFDDKPPQEVTDKLKEYGFRWNSQDKLWARPIEAAAALQDRIDAEKLFQEVATMLRKAKGLAPQEKVPF